MMLRTIGIVFNTMLRPSQHCELILSLPYTNFPIRNVLKDSNDLTPPLNKSFKDRLQTASLILILGSNAANLIIMSTQMICYTR